METFEYLGEPLTFERQAASSDAVAAIATGTYHITNVNLGFTSGGTYTPVVNDILIGATSGAIATITKVTVDTGTFAGGTAAGTFGLHNQKGTFNATAETLKLIKASDGSAVADAATSVAGDSSAATTFPLVKQSVEAKAVVVQVLTNGINYTTNGTAPTTNGNSTLAARGINMPAGSNTILKTRSEWRNFKWINATASSNAEVRFEGYF